MPRTQHKIRVRYADTDQLRAGRRASNFRDRAAGHGLRATVTWIGSWRDADGAFWWPGNRTWTDSPILDSAVLTLVDPRVYGGNAPGRSKSGSDWAIDGSGAS